MASPDCVVAVVVEASLGIHHRGFTVVLPSSSVVVTVVSGSCAYVMVFCVVIELSVEVDRVSVELDVVKELFVGFEVGERDLLVLVVLGLALLTGLSSSPSKEP